MPSEKKTVVTTGQHSIDIDGLACVIAYAEISPTEIFPVISGHINQSVTPEIKSWGLKYFTDVEEALKKANPSSNPPQPPNTKYKIQNTNMSFVVVDVSEADQFPPFVKEEKIIEIYDHHFGYSEKWKKLLGGKAVIEEIGACATLIWEEIVKRKTSSRNPVGNSVIQSEAMYQTVRGEAKDPVESNLSVGILRGKAPLNDKEFLDKQISNSQSSIDNSQFVPLSGGIPPTAVTISNSQLISPVSANLLYTAIASNTLNFRASITTGRDKKAFEELKPLTNLPSDWIPKYFLDQQAVVYANPDLAVRRDTKLQNIRGTDFAFGQLELWNGRDFLDQNKDVIEANLRRLSAQWIFSTPSIGDGKNYIFTKNEEIKSLLQSVMDINFEGNIGTTPRLWLRKEILKKIQ